MIKHLVMFKLADEAEGQPKMKNALRMKELLENLQSVIPVIRKINVYVNDRNASPENYDVVLDSEFDNMDDVNTYITHPAHMKVGEFIVKVRTARAAIDYEF